MSENRFAKKHLNGNEAAENHEKAKEVRYGFCRRRSAQSGDFMMRHHNWQQVSKVVQFVQFTAINEKKLDILRR